MNENCITYILASSKWTRVMCLLFAYFTINLPLFTSLVVSLIVHHSTLNRTLSTLRLINGTIIWDHVCMLVT